MTLIKLRYETSYSERFGDPKNSEDLISLPSMACSHSSLQYSDIESVDFTELNPSSRDHSTISFKIHRHSVEKKL
jgi:hypothetical protein